MLTHQEMEAARPKMLSWAGARMGREDAEDAVQETLLRALSGYERREEAHVEAYLFGVLWRVVMEEGRAKKREEAGATRLSMCCEEEPVRAGGGSTADLSELPAHLRQAVEERLTGATYAEIASVMGISPRAVRYRVQAGMERLARQTISLGYRSAEECFTDCARQYVYRAPLRTGSGLARERQGRLK